MANPIRSKSRGTVNSFLNEKIRTASDLDSLDVLLHNLQNQQELQKQQVGTFGAARKRPLADQMSRSIVARSRRDT